MKNIKKIMIDGVTHTIQIYENEFAEILCDACGRYVISDDPENAEHYLCDSCANEMNDSEVIGWRKGE